MELQLCATFDWREEYSEDEIVFKKLFPYSENETEIQEQLKQMLITYFKQEAIEFVAIDSHENVWSFDVKVSNKKRYIIAKVVRV